MSSRVPDSASVVAPGQVLCGKYEVERVLGAGGMGVVVAARHLQLKTRVALKFLLPTVASHGELAARFLREAQAASRITSEHVVRVLDVGTLDDGAPYMVMEHLDGTDLARAVETRGALPVQDAVGYVLMALEALAEAHGAGIVHRDLKPSNLFLTTRADGSPLVKVLDFGISKAPLTDAAEGPALTGTSGVMGSPHYMSPEQIRSAKNVDLRTDIWAIGVILYELTTGDVPFDADTMPGVLAKVVADPPKPLGERGRAVPAGLEAVIMRCLEKAPERRFASVAELARALRPFAAPGAAASIERICAIVARAGGAAPSAAVEAVSGADVPAVAPSTVVGWHMSQPSGRAGARKGLVLGAVAGAAALAVLLAVVLLRAPSSPTGAPSAAAPVATELPSGAPLPAPSPIEPSVDASAEPSAGGAPSVTAAASGTAPAPSPKAVHSAAAKGAPVKAPPAEVTAKPAASAKKGVEGLIDERR